MKFAVLALASCAAAVALSGCQSVLKDIQGCERHYNGTVSGGTINPAILAGSAKIDCCPVNTVANADHTNCVPVPTVGAPLTTGNVVAPTNAATAAPTG